MKQMKIKHFVAEYIREIIFGLEDSLVSTLGAIIGIAVGSQSRFMVILSGLVILAAEATSMSAGSYLSSKSATDTEKHLHTSSKDHDHKTNPVFGAVIMGLFYLVGGCVPLLPFFLFDVQTAIIPSIGMTALCLFLIGYWASRFTKRPAVKSGIEMMSVSLAAAIIGYLVGYAVSLYYGVNLPI